MIEITLIALKLVALIVGGVFAAIGLLTDYRDESGKVTRWGRIALFVIVLSTIIGAGTQGVESYRDRRAGLANDAAKRESEKQTRKVMVEIRRAVYPIRNVMLEYVEIEYPADIPPLSTALKGLNLRPSWMPREGPLPRFHFDKGNANYPKAGILLTLLEPSISVTIWRKDSHIFSGDFNFTLRSANVGASVDEHTLAVVLNTERIPDDLVALSQQMASVEDMRDGKIQLRIQAVQDGSSTQAYDEMFRKTRIRKFRFSIANHSIEVVLEPRGYGVVEGVFEGKVSVEE